jgi:hypothetical protein
MGRGRGLKLALAAVCLLAGGACPAGPCAAGPRTKLVPDHEARVGNFLWWRLEDGAVKDVGCCYPGPNVAQQNDMLSTDGTLLRVFATRFKPHSELPGSDTKLPEFKAGTRYYCALCPGVGLVAAQEHHSGETWVFQLDQRLIVSRYGFVAGGDSAVTVRCQRGRAKPQEWQLTPQPGFWLYTAADGCSDFAVGEGVAGCSELQPDWLKAAGRRLALPDHRGWLLVKDPPAGERWSCVIGGKTLAVGTQRLGFSDLARAETADYEVVQSGGIVQTAPIPPSPPIDLNPGDAPPALPAPDDPGNGGGGGAPAPTDG